MVMELPERSNEEQEVNSRCSKVIETGLDYISLLFSTEPGKSLNSSEAQAVLGSISMGLFVGLVASHSVTGVSPQTIINILMESLSRKLDIVLPNHDISISIQVQEKKEGCNHGV